MLPTLTGDGPHIVHASAVAVGGRGLMITGASGSGKSSLALQLISLGATLVSDDRVVLRQRREGGVFMTAPGTIRGQIEARGIGVLNAASAPAMLATIVDLDQAETQRFPQRHCHMIGSEAFPVIRRVENPAFASMLLVYLKGGRLSP
mgnify:CR=1 FL=1